MYHLGLNLLCFTGGGSAKVSDAFKASVWPGLNSKVGQKRTRDGCNMAGNSPKMRPRGGLKFITWSCTCFVLPGVGLQKQVMHFRPPSGLV